MLETPGDNHLYTLEAHYAADYKHVRLLSSCRLVRLSLHHACSDMFACAAAWLSKGVAKAHAHHPYVTLKTGVILASSVCMCLYIHSVFVNKMALPRTCWTSDCSSLQLQNKP